MSLNLILGHSSRAAISTMTRCRSAHTVCVVSPSPRAERRMTDEDLIDTFKQLGQVMKRMIRLEIHFYSSNALWLPVRALTACFQNSTRLENVLINGCRLRGSVSDFMELGRVFETHTTMRRACLFNIDSLRGSQEGAEGPMHYILEGITRNPGLFDLTVRFARWANPHLGCVTGPNSFITQLRMSGKETMYGPEGDGISQGFPFLMDGLKTNDRLTELIINQSPGPVGTGALVAEMLRHNNVLTKIMIHLRNYEEVHPIADALARDNQTLLHLDLFIHSDINRKGGAAGLALEKIDIKKTTDALEAALVTNGSLESVNLSSRSGSHVTDKISLFVRMNLAGRMELLQNDEIDADEALGFLERHGEDTSLIFYMIRMKPSLIPLVVEHASKVVVKEEDSDNEDEEEAEPIKFGVEEVPEIEEEDDDDEPVRIPIKRKKTSSKKRPLLSPRTARIQAAPARTLKRRRRK